MDGLASVVSTVVGDAPACQKRLPRLASRLLLDSPPMAANLWPRANQLALASDDDLVGTYAEAAEKADDISDRRSQNAAARCILAIRKELQSRGIQSERALLPLLDHPHAGVRLWAARGVLEFDREPAEATLTAIAESDKTLRGFTAQITLREWRAGRLPRR